MTNLSEDFKAKAKVELLGLAENVAKDTVESVFNLIELAIKDSENKFDDMLLPVLPKLKDIVLGYVDGIQK